MRLLHSTAPVGVNVLDAAGVPARVGEDPDDPAVGSQVEVAGRKRLGNRGQAGVPPLVVEGTKTPAPGAVGGRRVPIVGLAVHGDRRRVGMQTQLPGGFGEDLARAEGSQGWQGVGFAAPDERVVLVARYPDQVLDRRVVWFQLVVRDGPVGQCMTVRQRRLAEALAYVSKVVEMVGM